MTARTKSAIAALFFAIWFLAPTWRGIFVDFTEDDLMNMYQAWRLPLAKLAVANLTPFTSVYRPFGSLFYHTMYSLAGLHSLPFRIFAYAILLLNIALVYRAARLLTNSRWTGLLCALMFSYHKRLYALFVNGGTIYDLLSVTFFLLALEFYISTRGQRVLAFCALYTLALNSKEMAAALPAILLAYELLFHFDEIKRGSRWIYKRRAIWIAAAMTIAAFAFRRIRGSAFYGVHDYDLQLTAAQYFDTTTKLLSQLFFLPENTFGIAAALSVFAAAIATGILLRDRVLLFAAAFAILAPLPINFITYRGFFVMYLPLAGWALFFSTLLVRLTKRIPPPAVFAAVAIALFTIQIQDHTWAFDFPRIDEERIHRMKKDLAILHDSLPAPHRVLFLHQTLDPAGYVPLYILRLLYRDPAIIVDVAGSGRTPQPIAPESYDLVIDFCNGRYMQASCK